MKRRDKQSHEQTANTPSNRTPPLNPQHRQKVQRTKPSIWSSNGGITGVSSLAEDLDGECDGSLWTSLFLLHFSTTRTTNTPSNRAINPSTQPATTAKKVQTIKPSMQSSNAGITGVPSFVEALDGECDGSLRTSPIVPSPLLYKANNKHTFKPYNPSTQPPTTAQKNIKK